MIIARSLLIFLVAFAVIYSVFQVLSIPSRRRQALTKKNAKQTLIFITSCILAVCVVAFIQVADKLF